VAGDGSNGINPLTGATVSLSNTPYPIPDFVGGGVPLIGGGATYDPLGRRGFISLTMEF
jgi:hypothetical protein